MVRSHTGAESRSAFAMAYAERIAVGVAGLDGSASSYSIWTPFLILYLSHFGLPVKYVPVWAT